MITTKRDIMNTVKLNFKTIFKIASRGIVFLSMSAFSVPVATALPTGGSVVNGNVNIATSNNVMNIDQTSAKSIINWNNYNVGSGATVNYRFTQPGSSSLNRVTGTNLSEIHGKINANGHIILVNPNGIIFANGSTINVRSIIATTHNIENSDYLNGKLIFSRNGSTGSVINNGTITAEEGSYIALLAPSVINQGVIKANMGTISLASGDKIKLSFDSSGMHTMIVDPSTIQSLIDNQGLVIAQGGTIYLGAKNAQNIIDSVINIKNSGIIEANQMNKVDGRIILDGDGIEVSGTLQANSGTVQVGNQNVTTTHIASSAILRANFLETSAHNLKVDDGVTITAKTWLLDPTDILVSSAGSEALTGTPATTSIAGSVTVSGNTIQTQLNNGTSVLLDATNNITVSDNILKTSGTEATLTFKAANNIAVTAGTTISSTADKLNLVFWSNSDGDSNGRIEVGSSSSTTNIATNGGGIWMGGGSGTSSWTPYTSGSALSVGNGYARSNTTSANGVNGISVLKTSIVTQGGNVAMYGDADSSNTFNDGIRLYVSGATTSINTANGKIYLDGKTATQTSPAGNSWNFGIDVQNAQLTSTSSATDAITLTGYSVTSGSDNPIVYGATHINALNGGVIFNINAQNSSDSGFDYDANANLATSTLNASNFTITSNGKLNLDHLTTVANTTTLHAQNGIAITVNSANNSMGTLAIDGTSGAISALNSNALILGGISGSTGTIDIATLTGNLTLTGGINTSNTSSSAIVLNAGKSASAGTPTGGNIIVSGGTLTTGAGGRSTLYTGSVGGSTSMSSLIGSGSGKFRYNSDEATTNYSTALSDGAYAVYREPVTLSVIAANQTKVYDGQAATTNRYSSTISGFANGDTSSILTGSAPTTYTINNGTNAINTGTYTISQNGGTYANGRGYVIDYINGNLTINAATNNSQQDALILQLTNGTVKNVLSNVNRSLVQLNNATTLTITNNVLSNLSTTLKSFSNTTETTQSNGTSQSVVGQDKKELLKVLGVEKHSPLSIKTLKSNGFSAEELRVEGYTAYELKQGGYSLKELFNTGFSTKDMTLGAGCTGKQLKLLTLMIQNLSSNDLRTRGYQLSDLKEVGYSVSDLKSKGYTLQEFKSAGYSVQDIKDAGYTPQELKSVGY